MNHHGLICEHENIKFTLIQTPSLIFMCVLLRRLRQSASWDMNLPSRISPCSTKSCTSNRVCCSNMGLAAPIPLFPPREWFSDPWVSSAALCESNCWTESRRIISKLQPRGYAASSLLQALNNSEKIPVKNMCGKFKQAARHMLSAFEALMWSMRKAGRTEASCRKGADHSANKTENTFGLVVTVHQETQPKSLSAFLSERFLCILWRQVMFRHQDLLIYRLPENFKPAKKDFTERFCDSSCNQ